MKTTKEEIKEFLLDLSWWNKIEINNLNSLLKLDDGYGKDKIYFCCWFDKSKKWRCNDDDFTHKCYIPIDIDIRLDHYEKTSKVLSETELDDVIKDLLQKLKNKPETSDYRYAINSGNWLHLYYVWDNIEIDKTTYAHWVMKYQEFINEVISPYKCDPAVSNISRIMRMPWSINKRKKEKWWNVLWDLWDIECSFIEKNDKCSSAVWVLSELAKEYDKEQEDIKRVRIETRTQKNTQSDRSDINNINVWELACVARWVDIWYKRWDCIALKEPHKNMWAYIYEPENVVVNKWSSLIREKSKNVFTPYDIVFYEICNKDTKATLEYFKDHYNVAPKWWAKKHNDSVEIKHIEHSDEKWFLYPSKIFDDTFECFRSEEVVTIVAWPNTWKTTFAMDIITRNKDEMWRKWLYINLEFDIRNVWRQRWLSRNWYSKRNITDIAPLPQDKRIEMDSYVDRELSKFDYINKPNWIDLDELVQILSDKASEWYELVVIDTLWDIHWNSWEWSWSSQNKTMQTLQDVAQKTWMAIIILHHINKNWKFSWSMKIKDYSNVFIEAELMVDAESNYYTEYKLTKDKFKWDITVDCYYNNWSYCSDYYDSRI